MSALMCYMTLWGQIVLCDLSNKLERKSIEEGELKEIASYHDIPHRIGGKTASIIVPMLFTMNIGIMCSNSIDNFTIIALNISQQWNMGEWCVKLPIGIIVIILIILITEPERFAAYSFLMVIVVFAISIFLFL